MWQRDQKLRRGGQDDISEAEIRAEVAKVLQSESFTRSCRLSRFLSFVVEQALLGKADCLKEYVIAVEVLGKDASFDPRTDTIVRVHAKRLRTALTEYYSGAGTDDTLVISLPAGGYAPRFERRKHRSRGLPVLRVGGASALVATLLIAGTAWWARTPIQAQRISSTVILPFVDLGPDRLPEYFCEGLAEEIINALSAVEDIRVVARNSAFRFKGNTADIPAIGRQLRVDTVLQGSIRKDGSRLRVTAKLVKVPDGYHLWSENYDRTFTDVLDLQDEIARDVVARLGRRYKDKPRARVPEAHEFYLRGRFHWNRWTVHDFRMSIQYYEQAIAKDPTFALAYAGLADAYGTLGHLGGLPVREAYAKKEQALAKALRLDPDLPEAHAALAMTKAALEWNWQDAEREFNRALALQPQSADTRRHFAVLLLQLGRFNEARNQIERALDLDPLSAQIRGTAAHVAHHARDYPAAKEWYTRALQADPNFFRAHLGLGELHLDLGDQRRAIESLQAASRLAPENLEAMGLLGYAMGRAGRRHEAIAIAADMQRLAARTPVPAPFLADVYLGLGELDRALDLLEQGYEAREGRLIQIKVNPRYDPLRSHPRFGRLLKKLGFTL